MLGEEPLYVNFFSIQTLVLWSHNETVAEQPLVEIQSLLCIMPQRGTPKERRLNSGAITR